MVNTIGNLPMFRSTMAKPAGIVPPHLPWRFPPVVSAGPPKVTDSGHAFAVSGYAGNEMYEAMVHSPR